MDRDPTTPHPPSRSAGTNPSTLDAAMAEVRVLMTVILARTQQLRHDVQSDVCVDAEATAETLAGVEAQLRALEAALHASESGFRAIIAEATDFAILTTDAEGRIDGWYPGAEAVFGWPAEAALGKSVAITFTEPDRASGAWRGELEQARQTGHARDVRWHVRKDGTPVFIDGSALAVKGPDGAFQGLLKIGQDITAWRSAEMELRESEARFRTLVQNLPDYAIFTLSPDGTITITMWSEGAERVTGFSADEVIGQPVSMLYPSDQIKAGIVRAELREAAARGRAERDCWRVHKDGKRYWVNEITTAVGDDSGRLVGFTNIGRDLTERMRAEEVLRKREERYRVIFEEARNYSIFTTDVENHIETWTPGAAAVFGWSAEEAIGQMADVTFTPEDRDASVPVQEHVSARDSGSTPDVRWHQRKDGRRVFIEGTSYAIRRPNGEFRGLFKIGQDVTERKRAEEALRESEEQLQQRVAEATAELRSLSQRLLMVQEEERRHLARELHDEVGQVLTGLGLSLRPGSAVQDGRLEEARRIVHDLTHQVRQLSMDLRPSALDSHGLLPALIWHFERYQDRTGVRVDLRHEGVGRRFPPPVEIAAYRIVQEALTNVARHARVRHATVQLLATDGTLMISVRDRGHGFDPEARSDSSGASGMGERAQLVGGTLTIDAAPSMGTLVTAELPIGDEDMGTDVSREVP